MQIEHVNDHNFLIKVATYKQNVCFNKRIQRQLGTKITHFEVSILGVTVSGLMLNSSSSAASASVDFERLFLPMILYESF